MKNYILILMSLFLISCNFNKYYKNRDADKQDAEKVTENFYSLITNNREQAFLLFGNKFFQVTSKEQLNQIFNDININCGNSLNIQLLKWETLVSVGTNPKSEYVLLYKVKRNIKNTQEKITLEKDKNIIKIVGYDVNLSP